MRSQWECPDLGITRDFIPSLPIEGTDQEFDCCPAAFLRTAGDLPMLRDRFGKEPYAPHLIDGHMHPYQDASSMASEIESGARSVDTVSPRVMSLVHIIFGERNKQRKHESETRRAR